MRHTLTNTGHASSGSSRATAPIGFWLALAELTNGSTGATQLLGFAFSIARPRGGKPERLSELADRVGLSWAASLSGLRTIHDRHGAVASTGRRS